ncbi:MAG: hypothetical protein OD817_00605 [Gammaproteobacteria bacterium]
MCLQTAAVFLGGGRGGAAANIAGMSDVIAQPFAKREVEITARRR